MFGDFHSFAAGSPLLTILTLTKIHRHSQASKPEAQLVGHQGAIFNVRPLRAVVA